MRKKSLNLTAKESDALLQLLDLTTAVSIDAKRELSLKIANNKKKRKVIERPFADAPGPIWFRHEDIASPTMVRIKELSRTRKMQLGIELSPEWKEQEVVRVNKLPVWTEAPVKVLDEFKPVLGVCHCIISANEKFYYGVAKCSIHDEYSRKEASKKAYSYALASFFKHQDILSSLKPKGPKAMQDKLKQTEFTKYCKNNVEWGVVLSSVDLQKIEIEKEFKLLKDRIALAETKLKTFLGTI